MSNVNHEITVLGAGTLLKGELHLAGPATIAGRVEGMVIAQDLVQITTEGSVQGDVQGGVVEIHGSVKGNVLGTKAVRLGASATVTGELRAANLAIAEGACFIGHVHVGGAVIEGGMEEAIAPVREVQELTVNRIQALTQQADDAAAEAVAAGSHGTSVSGEGMPGVNVVQQNILNSLNRVPKIIRARA